MDLQYAASKDKNIFENYGTVRERFNFLMSLPILALLILPAKLNIFTEIAVKVRLTL